MKVTWPAFPDPIKDQPFCKRERERKANGIAGSELLLHLYSAFLPWRNSKCLAAGSQEMFYPGINKNLLNFRRVASKDLQTSPLNFSMKKERWAIKNAFFPMKVFFSLNELSMYLATRSYLTVTLSTNLCAPNSPFYHAHTEELSSMPLTYRMDPHEVCTE